MKKKEHLTYEPSEVQSRASLLALRKQYFDDPQVDTTEPYKRWLIFRMELLTLWEEERGSLKCHDCGRDHLEKVTEGVEPKYQATLDHVIPRAAGCNEYDVSNLVVACRICNERKADNVLSTDGD